MPGGLITDLGKRRSALLWAQNITHGAVGSGTWADKFNPPNENFEANPVAWIQGGHTGAIAPAGALTPDGAIAIIAGSYALVATAGTMAGTMALSFNGGAIIDNIAPNTNGIQFHGGAAGLLTVNVGILPVIFPQTDTVQVFFGLTAEFGRVPIDVVSYLIADPMGTINYITGFDTSGHPIVDGPYRYAITTEIQSAASLMPPVAPSSDIEVQFTIPAVSATGQVMCELALFMNAITSVPGYAAPAQVMTPGIPLYICNFGAKVIDANDDIVRRVRLML